MSAGRILQRAAAGMIWSSPFWVPWSIARFTEPDHILYWLLAWCALLAIGSFLGYVEGFADGVGIGEKEEARRHRAAIRRAASVSPAGAEFLQELTSQLDRSWPMPPLPPRPPREPTEMPVKGMTC